MLSTDLGASHKKSIESNKANLLACIYTGVKL